MAAYERLVYWLCNSVAQADSLRAAVALFVLVGRLAAHYVLRFWAGAQPKALSNGPSRGRCSTRLYWFRVLESAMLGLSLAMLVKPSLLAKFAKHLDRPIQKGPRPGTSAIT